MAGLTAAITLGRYGVNVMLIDRRHESSPLPRATVISTRSMELLRSWGLENDVAGGGVDADICLWECDTLAAAASGRKIAVGYPTREQASVISPTAPAVVPQDWLEAVLRRHVRSLPAVRVELGVELVAVHAAPDGVRATVRHGTGEHGTIRAGYLVAADGAHSTVRRLLDVPMRGPDDAMTGAQVLFHAPLWRLLGDIRYALYSVTTPAAPGTFLPAGRPDRWVYGRSWAPGEEPPDLDPARVAERIRWVPVWPISTSGSSTSAVSGHRANSPIASGSAPCSWSVTRRTASRRAAAPG